MTRAKRLFKKLFTYCKPVIIWVLVFAAELLLSALPAALVAAELLPLAYAERGRMAFGGEWLVVALVFCIAFHAVHAEVCKTTEKEGRPR